MRSKCGGEHREERVRRSSSRSTSACGAPAPGPAPGPLPPAPHAGAPAPGQLRMREHHLRVQLRAGARPPGPPPCGDLLRVQHQLRAGEAFSRFLPVLLPVAPAALLVTRPSHKRKPVAARDARALHASPARRPSMTAIWSRGHRGAACWLVPPCGHAKRLLLLERRRLRLRRGDRRLRRPESLCGTELEIGEAEESTRMPRQRTTILNPNGYGVKPFQVATSKRGV